MTVTDWLLEGDRAVRWQVMADLTDAEPHAVESERTKVAIEGWGKALLEAQEPNGQWGGGFYSPKWISTTYTLLQLRHYGIDPDAPAMRAATDRLIAEGGTWRHGVDGGGGVPFFEYLGETCVTAMNLALACYFGTTSDRTTEVVVWLLGEQLADGGWNCETQRSGSVRSSFHTTISTLEGLLEFERSGHAPGLLTASRRARSRAYDYLLDRRLMRSLRTGEIINDSWRRFSFPPRWWFDVLRGLDHLRDANVAVDERWSEALDLLEKKRGADGRWALQNHHSGREHFRMEQPGRPSRWNSLRALRVLRYAERDAS
jgi:hypothetical protein